MSTFILGVSATIVVGMFVWFTIDTIKQLKTQNHETYV